MGREGGREGGEGGEGRGGEGRGGMEVGEGGREGREEGRKGRGGREGRGDCYTYSNLIQWQSRHVLRNNVSRCLPMAPQYLKNNHVTYYVITQVGVYAVQQCYVLRPT